MNCDMLEWGLTIIVGTEPFLIPIFLWNSFWEGLLKDWGLSKDFDTLAKDGSYLWLNVTTFIGFLCSGLLVLNTIFLFKESETILGLIMNWEFFITEIWAGFKCKRFDTKWCYTWGFCFTFLVWIIYSSFTVICSWKKPWLVSWDPIFCWFSFGYLWKLGSLSRVF